MAANNNSPQYPPLNGQIQQQVRVAVEIVLDPDMPEPEESHSPVAGDPGSDNCLGLFYRIDVDALETWDKKRSFCPCVFDVP